jgi:hypothetical protein
VYFEHVTDVPVQRDHRAGVGTRKFDGRFGRFDVDERLVQYDDVADGHLPRDDLGFGQTFTDVG